MAAGSTLGLHVVQRRGRRLGLWVASLLLLGAALPARASPGYYAQAVGGHLELMRAARPVAEWVQDPQTPEALRKRLELSQRMRQFASDELLLPDNASYRR